MRIKRLIGLIASCMFILSAVCVNYAFAQSTFGSVLGSVKDASGSVVPNATVKIINVDENTSRTVTTNSNGDYEAANMKPGRYRIEVSASGFQQFTTSEAPLVARQTLRVDATLGAGRVTEQVNITANAGVITTETQTISSAFEPQKILNLPANYRAAGSTSPYTLIAALPGVQADNGNNFSIQGALPSQSQFSLDGISTTNVTGNSPLQQAFPSAESIAEIKVQGVGNAAEYGQVGDVTTISKSGTNEYHATAFWFHQNRALDSKAFGSLTKPQKIGNDFGASGGGPVRIPWLYNGRDRTFFFGTFEGFRFPRGQTVQNTVPTQAMRNGDFSAENVIVRDPLTGLPFAGNRIPDNRISPIAKSILTLYPLPNNGPTDRLRVANYIRNSSSSLNSDQYDIRIDHHLTQKQSIFGRWTWKDVAVDSPNILDLPSNTNYDRYKILAQLYDHAESAQRSPLRLYHQQQRDGVPVRRTRLYKQARLSGNRPGLSIQRLAEYLVLWRCFGPEPEPGRQRFASANVPVQQQSDVDQRPPHDEIRIRRALDSRGHGAWIHRRRQLRQLQFQRDVFGVRFRRLPVRRTVQHLLCDHPAGQRRPHDTLSLLRPGQFPSHSEADARIRIAL
jgi:Carboxypeptidase regulatory-like domain